MSSFHVDEGNSTKIAPYNMDRSTRKHRTVLRLVGERSFLAEAAANPAEGRLPDHHGIVRSGVEAMLQVKTDSEGESSGMDCFWISTDASLAPGWNCCGALLSTLCPFPSKQGSQRSRRAHGPFNEVRATKGDGRFVLEPVSRQNTSWVAPHRC
jgi:hypothetical protein